MTAESGTWGGASPTIVAATSALLTWPHRSHGQARCLVRLRIGIVSEAGAVVPDGAATSRLVAVAVVSQLRDDVRGREITSDFAGVANTAVRQLIPPSCPPDAITWYAHHGPFSTYDHTDEPETLTRIELRWDGQRYPDPDLRAQHLLPPPEMAELMARLRLEPVEQILSVWAWGSTPGTPVPRRG